MAARKLKHYFEEHPITVVSTTPLSKIIGCKYATGRVAKWAIKLAAYTIQYKPRTTIKSQILADFFADWGENQYLPSTPDSTYLRMNFDRSKMHGGLGAGVVPTSPKGDKLHYVLQIHFTALNNGGCKFVGGGVSHELGFLPLYSFSDFRLPILGRTRSGLTRPSGLGIRQILCPNVCREIPYNFVVEEFSV
jgi:hypothetical protein